MTDTPTGYIQYVFAFDVETTGLCFKSPSPVFNPKTGERHQILSIGIIIASADTLKPVEKTYIEIKWNHHSIQQRQTNPNFGKEAENIHGLTREYLDANGITEEEAILQIGELILKYWGPDVAIKSLGHNVHMFDIPFLLDMFDRYNISIKMGNRHYDSNSLGFGTVGAFNSEDLFTTIGLPPRKHHNALEDAGMSLESFRRIRTLWQDMVRVKAYE